MQKMSYYRFNRLEILQKAKKKRHSKEKAEEYYAQKEKTEMKEYQKKKIPATSSVSKRSL